MLEAVRVGHAPVVGVEINEKIVALHRGPMREYAGIAGLAGVELVADEARSFLARDRRRYEVITMSLIDTWASTGAGAYSLSENGLYTVEGWQVFLQRLTPTGIFTVSRWYVTGSPGETGRMLALAMTTLWEMGAKDPRAHIILLQQASVATLLAACAYFALIGLGFMFVEIGLLSRVGVFLGHPTLALAVVLGGIILATGIGSLISGVVPVERPRVAWFFPLLPGLLVVAARAVLAPVMTGYAAAPLATRVLLTLVLVAPPALAMGLCFPLGLRLVQRARDEAATDITPWLWGVNGACGVCASGLALGVSMVWGISATLAVGAVCYFALPLCTWWLARRV